MEEYLDPSCFEQLFEEIPEAIVLVDYQGTVIRVNQEFSRMFGYSAEEAQGCPVDYLIAPAEHRAEATTITEAVAHGQKFTLEAIRQRKDGSLVHVSLLGVPIITQGGDVILFGIYRDITERKKAEQAQHESRSHMDEAYAQLELVSNRDGLTGIPNRGYFDRFYRLEWGRMAQELRPLAVVLVDVDLFKRYNDHYGHLVGDQCLRRVAQALQVSHRTGDLVARYGGEEFVAVLSGAGLADARQVAERMRQRIMDLRIPHEHSSVAGQVTISLGVSAQVPEPGQDPRTLILKADQALYQAKALGRNRVEAAEP